MASRTCNVTLDDEELADMKRFLLMTSLAVEVVGSFLLIGIILYEHYGGDPQKRTIINQLTSSLGSIMLAANLVPLNVFIWRLSVGPVHPQVAKFLFFASRSGLTISALFALDEILLIKYASLFIWKRVAPINDEFFYVVLCSINSILGFLFGIWGVMGQNVLADFICLMTGGSSPEAEEKPIFRFYMSILSISLLLHIFCGGRMLLNRLKEKAKKWRMTSPSGGLQTEDQPRYNNNARNADITNALATFVIMLSLVLFLQLFQNASRKYGKNSPMIDFLVLHGVLTILVPSFFWISHPKIFAYIFKLAD